MKRIGFIIDSQLPSWTAVRHGRCGWRGLCFGLRPSSSVALMRFGWVADAVNAGSAQHGYRYELYRPWRRYAAVVFLKSMGPECLALAERIRAGGGRVLFDANVDYYSEPEGTFYYEGMAPSDRQRDDAKAISRVADAVIADSEHIARMAAVASSHVEWIPDNLPARMIESQVNPGRPLLTPEGRLRLLWCGEAVKLFDLLEIESVLRERGDRVFLDIVTSDRSALDRWVPGLRERFESMLEVVPHRFSAFTNLEDLMAQYQRGGVFISPRCLDNSYNLGHTEWKVALPLAAGCPVLASPQPSYLGLEAVVGTEVLRICRTEADWLEAFDGLSTEKPAIDAAWPLAWEALAGAYGTEAVAARHLDLLRGIVEGKG